MVCLFVSACDSAMTSCTTCDSETECLTCGDNKVVNSAGNGCQSMYSVNTQLICAKIPIFTALEMVIQP